MGAHARYVHVHVHVHTTCLQIHTYLSCAQAGKTAYEVATAEVKTAMDAYVLEKAHKKEQVGVCACMCACMSACCIRVVMFM